MCGLVRDRGRKLEPDLWASWGGSPTIRRLRWRDSDDEEALGRLHARVNTLLDDPLPDAHAELDDSAAADRRYAEAVALLRELTRDTSRYRLVFAENVEYGFRRNALGLRSLALTIAGAALFLSLALLVWGTGDPGNRFGRWGFAAAVSTGLLLYWWLIVTPQWVRRSAELYADRLLEAVGTRRVDTRL